MTAMLLQVSHRMYLWTFLSRLTSDGASEEVVVGSLDHLHREIIRIGANGVVQSL